MPTIAWNKQAWGRDHRWDADGDEWSGMAAYSGVPYEEWKQELIEAFLLPYVSDQRDVLEIAPGHGRWSETLVRSARSVHLVDINPECIDACRARFADVPHVSYHVNDGRSLPLDDASVDFVWSFDSFVHIDPDDVFSYLGEIARVLRPGGYAVLHHANKTAAGIAIAPRVARFGRAGRVLTQLVAQHKVSKGGNRSHLNGAMVARRAEDCGLHVVQQTDRWGPGGRSKVARFRDVITVLRRS